MAHTSEEHLEIGELERSIDQYIHLATACLREVVLMDRMS